MRTLFVKIICDRCGDEELIEHTSLGNFYKVSGWEQHRDGMLYLDVCKECLEGKE